MGPKRRGRPKTKKAAPPPEDSADEILSDDLELKETLFPLTLVLFVKINLVPYHKCGPVFRILKVIRIC
jgi:hypothetical protein